VSRPALTGNAADPQQVARARRKEAERGERFLVSLQAIMRTREGRLVMWELLSRAGIYRSIWDPSSKIHYNAGRQDYGHELLASVIAADSDLYQQMEREQRAFEAAEDRGTAASQTKPATEGAQTDGR
jgi:type II secretory pathway component PulM